MKIKYWDSLLGETETDAKEPVLAAIISERNEGRTEENSDIVRMLIALYKELSK